MKALKELYHWFESKGWSPFAFQEQTWNSFLAGKSGLLSVPTGSGKTFAVFGGPLSELQDSEAAGKGLKILYISPLRAVTRDIERSLLHLLHELKWKISLETRTGDTSPSQRKNQKKLLSDVLLTTPESLSVMLSSPEFAAQLHQLQVIIIDECHELMGSKRGTMTELCLARLRKWNPNVKIWGVSATIGNLAVAAEVFIGNQDFELVTTVLKKPIEIRSVLPEKIEQIPWSGHFGIQMLPYLLKVIDPNISTLIFTNTRSQAEAWYQAFIEAKPEWIPLLGLHHSAIDREERNLVEEGVKKGEIRIVICTSSLDLGVDFTPVERVVQIGSLKSLIRLIQRAGRASHQPLKPSTIYLMPTYALQVVEIMGLRLALNKMDLEKRTPLLAPFDVLLQHLVTCSLGTPFEPHEMYQEVISAYSYKSLSIENYKWCLQFLVSGGSSLERYPEYHKLIEENGRCTVKDKKIALRHRLSIGTIPNTSYVPLQQLRGGNLGYIEEDFISRMGRGDQFLFGGKILELVQYRDLVAIVKPTRKKKPLIPRWQGKLPPVSESLLKDIRLVIQNYGRKEYEESSFLNQICQIQEKLSAIPKEGELLIESYKAREGWHYYFYPFEGPQVHEVLASIVSWKISENFKGSYITTVNDYGFEILSSREIPLEKFFLQFLFSSENLEHQIQESINTGNLAQRNFRDIAQIAGLIFTGYPGKQKTNRQLQIGSSVLFDVFKKYDPGNLLIQQAYQEVLDRDFDFNHLKHALHRLEKCEYVVKSLRRMTPFALPLYIEMIHDRVSSESLLEKIQRIKSEWKKS